MVGGGGTPAIQPRLHHDFLSHYRTTLKPHWFSVSIFQYLKKC